MSQLLQRIPNPMAQFTRKYDLRNKVALITGSSSGIGAAIAITFAAYGARVAITGRNAENLEKIAQKIRKVSLGNSKGPLQIVGDLQDDAFPAKLITGTIAEFGKLDILVNNAGAGTPVGTLGSETLLEEFDIVMKLNVRSVVDLTQRAVPFLVKSGGNIVNISSAAGQKPFWLVYSASKAALDMVTKTCALELGPKGIRVNSINPGPVSTCFGRSFGKDEAEGEEMFKSWATMTVLQRVAGSDEIANLAAFLASEDAKNITGAIMLTDGGICVK